MATVRRVTPLEMLVDQLWAPGTGDGVRVEVDPRPQDGWRTVERYWLLPDARAPRLLLPVASASVVHAAVTHYRGLRKFSANAARGALGAVARTGLPLSRARLAVQVASDADAASLPLATIGAALDQDELYATFGVRTGANRKATLQLLDGAGQAVGYAKLGWNATADEYVRTETAALAAVGGRAGAMRAPALLGELEQGGRPVVVAEPLPSTVRGARGDVRGPSPEELYALCPVVRRGTAGDTEQLRRLQERWEKLRDPLGGTHEVRALVNATDALLKRALADPREVPVQERWHGDLTPWNCAREPGGQLWAWDWESSETDAVAGLDAVHWEFSRAREAGRLPDVTLAECVATAKGHLRAAGHSRETDPVVTAVYALTVVERAASLAVREEGWERIWVTPSRLGELVDEACLAIDPAS